MPIFGQRGLGKPAIALLVVSGGCGSSPTRPGDSESSNLPLAAGSYVLVTSAFASSPTVPCQGTGTFSGVSLLSRVTLSREGTTWIVRPERGADGDVELRFVEGATSFGAVTVSGSARGTARDLRSPGGAVTITFAGQGTSPAMLLGGTSTFSIAQVAGEISGSITVTGSLGSGTCPRALWGIRKPEAGEID